MAIPAMPNSNTTYVQTGNIQNLISWNYVPGATAYKIQRSTDGGNTYALLASPTVNFYVDSAVTAGNLYYYRVASENADGTSSYTPGQGVVPTIAGQLSLGGLRLAAQQRADRVNSNFVTLPEWNFFINQSAFELYDLLVTNFEDYYVAQPTYFYTTGSTGTYALPNGILTFKDQSLSNFVARPFYKLLGVDLGLNANESGFVTIKKFNFIDRNKYAFPTAMTTPFRTYPLQYRIMGNNLEIIPVPAANQIMRLWYIPRMPQLLLDTDVLDGVSGWSQYVIVRAAKYALDKEESDTTKLDQEITYLKGRIEEAGMNRDVGQADTISDTRSNPWGNGNGGPGYNGGPW